MKNKRVISFILGAIVFAGVFTGCSKSTGGEAETDSLVEDVLAFPADDYTEEKVTVNTSQGNKTVTYKYYKGIVYAGAPVDREYETMDVKVPIKINGKAIDADNAPIVFSNSVKGYLSSKVSDSKNENTEAALAAGYVVVEAGCRGSDNAANIGVYYGKAPAAIVDIKAAIKYLKHNDDVMAGNAQWIVAIGDEAGGGLSALLGASGGSSLYDEYLKQLDPAEGDDTIYASASFSPVTDIEHLDMLYEGMFGSIETDNEEEKAASTELANQFNDYQNSLGLKGENNFGNVSADRYKEYMLNTYLIPAANTYIGALDDDSRSRYLQENPWIKWSGSAALFTFEDYVLSIGRLKEIPAFDNSACSGPLNILFGDPIENARHFTNFSLRNATGDDSDEIAPDLQDALDMMNPMKFILSGNEGMCHYWWIRTAAKDINTPLTVMSNMSAALQNKGSEVNAAVYWNEDSSYEKEPEALMNWIAEITGYVSANEY